MSTSVPDPRPLPRDLLGWLRERDDDELVELLRRRPDLSLPAPPDLAALANRLGVRTSVQRAVDGLDAYTLHVLEALVLSGASAGPLSVAEAQDWLAGLDPRAGLRTLRATGLIWGDDDAVTLVPHVADALGQYPAALGRPAARLFSADPEAADRLADPDAVTALLAACTDEQREVLRRLDAGPPVGTHRAARGPGPRDPVRRLVDEGLLAPLDPHTVELPREVGLALRPHPLGTAVSPVPPAVEVNVHQPAELDRTGATTVLEVLRLVDSLAQSWARTPPAQLRAGGLGMRDLRRTARELGVEESVAALLIETAAAAGLLAPTSGIDPAYLPTDEYDTWAAREPARQWSELAQAWLAMTRQPSLVNERGERDRLISALSPDVERGTIPLLRARLLDALAELEPGRAPVNAETLLDRWAWNSPRRARAQRRVAAAVLAEADLLGVTARGGLTGYSRTLRDGSVAVAEQVLATALPQPVDEFLVQPDLTVVVPGPPTRELAEDLGLIAELESSGGASVYRITESSVRRALDAGRAGPDLLALLRERSRTPIPQALEYLVSDAARRHGQLRTGSASAYLRCDDEQLLSRVLAERNVGPAELLRLAPTVAVSPLPVTDLLDVLRAAGFAPAAEAPDGGLITLAAAAPRAPARARPRPVIHRSPEPAAGQLRELVQRIRAGEALTVIAREARPVSPDVAGVTSATTMGVLRAAIRDEQRVWLGVVDADGTMSRHTMVPISMGGGFVRGHEDGISGLASYPLHRLAAVHVLAEPDGDTG